MLHALTYTCLHALRRAGSSISVEVPSDTSSKSFFGSMLISLSNGNCLGKAAIFLPIKLNAREKNSTPNKDFYSTTYYYRGFYVPC